MKNLTTVSVENNRIHSVPDSLCDVQTLEVYDIRLHDGTTCAFNISFLVLCCLHFLELNFNIYFSTRF